MNEKAKRASIQLYSRTEKKAEQREKKVVLNTTITIIRSIRTLIDWQQSNCFIVLFNLNTSTHSIYVKHKENTS